MNFFISGSKHNLGYSTPIPNINKNQFTMVASSMDPTKNIHPNKPIFVGYFLDIFFVAESTTTSFNRVHSDLDAFYALIELPVVSFEILDAVLESYLTFQDKI